LAAISRDFTSTEPFSVGKKWLGNNERFMLDFFRDYHHKLFGRDEFYSRWLTPLFFEALNSPQYTKVAYGNNDFSPEIEDILQKAPYLNGGLFIEKHGFDDNDWIISDSDIKEFFEFLFSHSFTIEENSLEDEDLQLNPEFLGIIFERLVNKANGAVYTPRTEVDLMCRLSLVKWLQKNLESKIRTENLYELFFKESEDIEDLKEGSFSKKEAQEILDKLQNIAICDPAVGSGAFLVGIMQVLDSAEQSLRRRYGLNGKSLFDRKKEIIKYSLYGVEVKEWAVWVCQLRLWLSLFVDAPDDLKDSTDPILPNLDFKVRQGDSLVQRVASKTFPVSGQIMVLTPSIKGKISELKRMKRDYYDNKSSLKKHDLKVKELRIYEEIIEEEIKTLKGSLMRLISENDHDAGTTLFEEKTEYIDQKTNYYEQKANTIREHIADLKEQKQALHSGGKPLVWGIEFAEIFAEKKGFDIVIGNPPYVRQELIEDPTGRITNKSDYKKLLQEMVRIDFPQLFGSNKKINAQSDLYTYFYIRSLRLLNPQGIHTFICSNSWLDVAYGAWLQEFLLERCPVDLIIDNHAKRSFESADVNTIISIIHAPITDFRKQVPGDHLIKFVAFKVPFEEAIFTENMLQIAESKEIISNEIFRVYPIENKELKDAGMEQVGEEQVVTSKTKYIGDKWGGKYLRAPDIYFTILEKGKDKLVRLGDIAEVRFGIKTGCNEFFYLPSKHFDIRKEGRYYNLLPKNEGLPADLMIEEEYLKPVIKSPKECRSILIDPKDLKHNIFICNKSKEELSSSEALKYIKWGEKQKTSEGIYWKDVPSVKGRKYWYSINIKEYSDFVVPCSFSNCYKIFENNSILVDKRMYEGFSTNNQIHIALNSTLFPLFMETGSRVGLGEGLLDVTVEEVQRILVLVPNSLSTIARIEIRTIKPIFEECGINPQSDIPIEEQEPNPLPDRAELDKIVFDALELTEEERKDVYRAVCRLVWNRINKAKSF